MSTVLAVSRPTEWNFPLFLHVLGAMVLVGSTLTCASLLGFAHGDVRLLRLGYWTLLLVGLPAFILTRLAGEWLADREGWYDEGVPDQVWLGIGFIVTDLGGLLFLIGLIAGGIGVRRLRRGKGTRLLTTTMAISVVLLAAYVVAVWAMAGKPD
ncbi:MAG TPA: hypothetical protein VHI12_07665 [Gaiellaceae bacterium]|jgi:hypothetical protein|nr:hypothetical protein [Gaiellaceae bacterium]